VLVPVHIGLFTCRIDAEKPATLRGVTDVLDGTRSGGPDPSFKRVER
jgi:hypothetical protein